MCVLVRRKNRGRLLVVLCALIVVGSLLIFVSVHRDAKLSPLNDKKTLPSFLDDEDAFVRAVVKAEERSKGFRETEENTATHYDRCTMVDCFDLSRCFSNFKVYVYPPNSATKSSFLYKRIIRVIKNSRYYTEDPDKACLFVPSLDTLDRDQLSNEYVANMGKRLAQLRYWNGGQNHLIFNLYSGTWPTYTQDLDFSYGKAILAKSSFSQDTYRTDFDISIPLMHKSHKEKAGEKGLLAEAGNLLPVWRKYLVIFKGKRYLYGIGSQTRNALYHLHNGRDILVLTTCKHGRDWDRMQDVRCTLDNKLYDKYDYSQLMINSTFCLVPRGRRLGSFRLLEVLQASCIPLSFSNGYVLPFSEVIDWRKALVTLDERQLFELPHLARSIPGDKIISMRLQTQFLWEKYFNSVEKVVSTTLEIIHQRTTHTLSPFIWNMHPGGLNTLLSFSRDLSDFPFYSPSFIARSSSKNFTAIIMATTPAHRMDSPLVLLIKNLCSVPHLQAVVVMWAVPGPPQVRKPPQCSVSVLVVERKGLANRLTRYFWPLPAVTTDAVLSLYEDTHMTANEVEFGFSVWQSSPGQLVAFTVAKHYWDPGHMKWGWSSNPANDYSAADHRAMFFHRYHGYLFAQSLIPAVKKLGDSSIPCLNLAMNFVVAMATGKPPIKIGPRMSLHHQADTHITERSSSCVNVMVNSNIFGHIPLQSSSTRADSAYNKCIIDST